MIRFLCLFWTAFLLPATVLAQPVQVTSGEHDGFTRLVLDYGVPQDWLVGRTTDGYELRLSDGRPVYNLTKVYDPIGRGRLASVWVDPESGALRIGIGCACHAQPFEFRPGIVVIDLKDGPPPEGSAFELALNGESVADLAPRPVPRPRARPARAARAPSFVAPAAGYDWTTAFLATAPMAAPPAQGQPLPPVLPGADPAIQPLRDVLLHQLSRGAAQGVVDMALPEPSDPQLPESDAVQIRITDVPGLRIDRDADAPVATMAAGGTCVADQQLDIAAWGTDAPVSEQMATATSGLVGEFDSPNPDAELRAVRFLLFIGFGAEARQVLTQVAATQPDADILRSLGHILDDTPDPAPAFSGMASCDTAAALWATLGNPAPPRGAKFDRAAILRTFSALPVHLRRHVGPRVVERLLAMDDAAAAEAVRDAIVRAPGDAGPQIALMQARLDLDGGNPDMADQRLEPLIASSGPMTPDALIAQVETHFAQRTPIDPGQITALEALLHERGDGKDAARFSLALIRARALAGQFDRAFADLPTEPQATEDVWALLAEIGPDSALLSHAVTASGSLPAISAPVAATLAGRLADLGFATQARDWLQRVPDPEPVLAVRIALQTGDARTALRLMSGSDDPAFAPLRSEALYRLADEAGLARVLAGAGDEEARWRAVSRARDWPQLAVSGPAPLQDLAAAAVGNDPVAAADPARPGPLAQGQALLEKSVQTRQQIADLLAMTAGPAPSGL